MIRLKIDDNKIFAYSPYNPDLPARAKRLGGKWSTEPKAWMFDARDEARVRELYCSIYGTDGTAATGDLVTVRATLIEDWSEHTGGLFLFGRQIARATGRDSGAVLAEGVVVVSGKGFGSGGSVKNWRTIGNAGTVFEVRDIPRPAYENKNSPDELIVELVETGINREALQAEREKLAARLAEIDALLAS